MPHIPNHFEVEEVTREGQDLQLPRAPSGGPTENWAARINPNMVTGDGVSVSDRTVLEKKKVAEAPVTSTAPGKPKATGGGGGVDLTPPPPTRMGVGPGGPVQSYDEAYAMLNAPPNLGAVQAATQTAKTGGETISAEFQEAAGDPIQYGAAERETVSGALAPFAESQETAQKDAYDEARKLVHRSYEGPESVDAGQWLKARGVAEGSQIAAEAMGTGEGRAALYELGGLTPGQARAESARKHAGPGYTREARTSAAAAGDVWGGLMGQLKESVETGRERKGQAYEAGREAREDLRDRQGAIVETAEGQAEDKNKQARENTERFVEFMQSGGDEDGLKGIISDGQMQGLWSAKDARDAYVAIIDKPEYSSAKGTDPMVLAIHYTGQLMLTFSDKTKDQLKGEFNANGDLDFIFDNMRAHARGGYSWSDTDADRELRRAQNVDRPGRWLHMLMDVDSQGHQGAMGMLDRVRIVYARQQELEREFSPALPALLASGQDVRRGIRSPDEIAAEEQLKGHYFTNFLRPQTGTRGQYANVAPLYLGPSQAFNAPNLMSGGYGTPPEGVADVHSEIGADQARRYNLMQKMGSSRDLGAAADIFTAGTPMDPSINFDLDRMRRDETRFARESGEGLDTRERALRDLRDARRELFEEQYDKADQSIIEDIGDFIEEALESSQSLFLGGNVAESDATRFKGTPMFMSGGHGGILEEDDWGIRDAQTEVVA